MNKSFIVPIILSLFFTYEFIEANRRGGWGGGGANHGNNRWKQGGGGFTSWRQQQFKHTSNNQYIIVKNNDQNGNEFNKNHFNYNNNQQSSYNRNPEAPTVSFTHQPSETSCLIPTMGDSSKFEIRCILPTSEQDDECSSVGSFLPSGTSVVLRCKPPYKSETNEMRIWVCEEGAWKGEFKMFTCTHPPIIYHTDSKNNAGNNFFGNANDQNYKNNQRPNSNSWQRPQMVDQGTQTQTKPVNSNNWQQGGSGNGVNKPLIPNLIPGLLDAIISLDPEIPETISEAIDDTVRPPWFSNLEKWKPSSTTPTSTTTTPTTTTTTTTTTSTTQKPYLPPVREEPTDWSSYFSQKKEENNNNPKCPPLSKGTGIQLECLSKTPVPWDPSSFIVSQSNCTEAQPIGTEATYKCDQYYEGVGLTIQYRKCKDGGQWTGGGSIFSCALECGKSNPVGRIPLITNGEPTYQAQWPWHAALFYRDIRKEKHDYNCGGTLINKKVVLTAAHCVTEPYSKSVRSVTQFRIDLGRYERTVDDEFVQSSQAEVVVLHPSYNPISYDSDLAIIILKQEASIGYHVRPICYPQTQNSAFEEIQLSAGSYGTVVGFGKDENGELSDMLHMARLKVVSQQECSENFADTNFGAALTKSTTFCAGLKNGTNVCSGDSGGGIYFPVSSGGTSRWYLQGLVSVGITAQDGSNRCDPTRFSVFTKISPYADWIVRVLSENDAL